MLQDHLELQTFELQELSDEKLVTVAPDTLLTEAIALMSQESASCVLIEQQSQLQGIFTERDLVKLTASGAEIRGIEIAEVMTRQLITLSTIENLNLVALISLLAKHSIRHLPLVDASGKVLRIITHRSLRKAFKASYLLKQQQVQEVMNRQVICSKSDRSIFQIANLLATHQVSCVLIVKTVGAEQPSPQGIVTERDLVNYRALGLDLHQIPVKEVMSTPLLPIPLDASLWDAHQLMQEHQIRRLVVTNQDGTLAGIITQTTILQALDREDLYQCLAELENLVSEKTEQLEAQIAEQKLLEQHLQTSQSQLRSILSGITDIILILDEQGRDIQVLSMDSEIAPSNKPELVSKTIEQFWQPETAQKFLSQVRQVIQTQQMLDFEYSIHLEEPQTDAFLAQHSPSSSVSPSGVARQFWFTAQINPMSHNSVIWIARDITRRKEAEIALQNAKAELEDRVWRRTQELQIANLLLQEQINRFFNSDRAQSRDLREPFGSRCRDRKITSDSKGIRSQVSIHLKKLNKKIGSWLNNIYQDKFPLWTGGAIAAVIALIIEILRQSGIIVPVPFMLLIITVTLSASLGGIVAGLWGMLVWVLFVIYAATVPFGPKTLTGGILQVTIGILVLGIVALIEGWTKEQNRKLTEILQFVNRNLDREVTQRTQELSAANAALKREIRDRIASQRALQKSEQKFRAIFNQTFQLCSFLKPDGTMIEANQTALDFGGLNLEDVVGKPFWETAWWTISTATQDQLQTAIARAAQGEFIRYEVDVWDKDQQVITIDFSIKPIFDHNDTVVFLIPEGRDISEQKAERLKRQQAENNLQRQIAFDHLIAIISSRFINLAAEKIDLGIESALQEIGEFTDVESSYVFLIDPGKQSFSMTHEWVATGIASAKEKCQHLSVQMYPWGFKQILQGKLLYIPSLDSLPPEAAIDHSNWQEAQVKSLLAIPLNFQEQVFGWIGFASYIKEKNWSQDWISLLKIVGEIFANTLQRKQSEQALKLSEQKFRAIFEQAAVGIAHTGLDKKFLRVNQRFADIVGYSPQDLQHLSFDQITYPADRASDTKHVQQLIRGEISTLVKEKRYIHKDGKPVWVKLTSALVYDADNKPDYFITIIEDIAQRKAAEFALEESETRFFSMVNSFPSLVWISGTDGLCTFFNHAWLDFTGKNIEQELGYGWTEGVHPDDLKSCLDIYQSALKQHQNFQMEYRLRRFDGEYRWLLDQGMSRFKTDGNFTGYIGTCIDITDLKRAKEIKKDAENKALMLKEIHHRIKNNLQIVSALLDLQSGQTKNPEIIDLLEKSQARIHTMGLIHEKLYGSATLDKINFLDYVDSLTKYLQTSFIPDDKEIAIILDIEPISLNIDSAIPCGLIINELVINALQHSFLSQQVGEIKISFSQLSPDRFCLTVQDNGIGIRENIDLENIQSLGLSLVNSLATMQLEGTLKIHKVNGTLFKIEFPLLLV